MHHPHPSNKLNEIFTAKPYQGVAPEQASFLFIGLDANYDAAIEAHAIFPKILEYHRAGVAFWQKYGVHHPFLLAGYSGDGKLYHRSFAKIGFQPEHAGMVSFAELLHVPTSGRSKLEVKDLSKSHLNRLNDAIIDGQAKYIFIPEGVAQLMRLTGAFPWLQKKPPSKDGPLNILYHQPNKTVYKHLHFSNYGKFEVQKQQELAYIGSLLTNS